MNPKVSIIVPIFNAENTICRMVDSLLLQTIDRYEIILIDDGSTDSSGSICDRYAKKQSNVRVVHKCNEGVSSARQVGINIAYGEYVIHADSDDWVEPNMLEELYCKAIKENADVVICDFFINNADDKSKKSIQRPSTCNTEIVLHELFQKLHGSCCNKLVKRSCYHQYKIKFPTGINHCEDLLTWVQLFQHPEVKIVYLPKAYYHYCANATSITRHYTRRTYEMRQRFHKALIDVLPIHGFEKEINNSAFNIFTEAFIYDVLSEEEIRRALCVFRKNIKEVKSIKWKIGFFFLYHHCHKMAHKFIHY